MGPEATQALEQAAQQLDRALESASAPTLSEAQKQELREQVLGSASSEALSRASTNLSLLAIALSVARWGVSKRPE